MTVPVPAKRAILNRKQTVFTVLALAVGAVGGANLTWFSAAATTVTGAIAPVAVSGHQGAPAITAAALVTVAAGFFLALSGPIARWVALGGIVLSGLTIALSSLGLMLNPGNAVGSALASATGVEEANPQFSSTLWGPITVALGVLIVLVGLLAAFSVTRWTHATSKYERPTSGTTTSHGPQSTAVSTGREGSQSDSEFDSRDVWDALSSGVDPTHKPDLDPDHNG